MLSVPNADLSCAWTLDGVNTIVHWLVKPMPVSISHLQMAEMAWHQGVDLWSFADRRLMRALEFHAAINNPDSPNPKECCYELKGIGFQPVWEVS